MRRIKPCSVRITCLDHMQLSLVYLPNFSSRFFTWPKWLVKAVASAFLLLTLNQSSALIVGPYTPDSSTLHLWHLNEGTVPVLDSVTGGTSLNVMANGAALGATSYSGFGTAFNTLEAGASITAGTNRDAILTASG